MTDDWRDLGDDELRARLLQRGWPEFTADELVRQRDEDMPSEVIDREMGDQ